MADDRSRDSKETSLPSICRRERSTFSILEHSPFTSIDICLSRPARIPSNTSMPTPEEHDFVTGAIVKPSTKQE